MRYYTIQNGSLLIADSFNALARFYSDIQPLPEDYEEGKYIVVESKEEIEVPDFDPETGELIGTHTEIKVTYTLELNPNYEEEQKAKEKARIAQLNMTRGDFIEGLILAQGKDEKDIIALIEVLPITDVEKKVYINRVKNALDFYRGYPVIDVLCGYLDVSLENMDKFFETKDYTYLCVKTEEESNTNETPLPEVEEETADGE